MVVKIPHPDLWKKIKQLCSYVVVGSVSAFIDFALLFLFVRFGIHYLIGNTIAFMSANIFNFLAGHYLVFNKNSRFTNVFYTYLGVFVISVIGLLINDGVMFISVDLILLPIFAGKIMATITGFFWNFSARKHWIYS